MSEELKLENKNLIPAGVAATKAGYTVDYITRLAREGKLRGRKIEGEWHVFFDDVETFKTQKNADKILRGKLIRAERKIELESRQEKLVPSSNHFSKPVPSRVHALALTALILLSGFTVGVSSYVVTGAYTSGASAGYEGIALYEKFALAVYRLFTFRHTELSYDSSKFETTTLQSPDYHSFGEGWDPSFGDIVISENIPSSQFDEEISHMFSDDVRVEFASKPLQGGVVTPNFRTGSGRPYHFELQVDGSSSTPK